METYLAQLRSFGHIPFEPLKQLSIVGQESAVTAPTATPRPRNATKAAYLHVYDPSFV
jgi:hypothetical protein